MTKHAHPYLIDPGWRRHDGQGRHRHRRLAGHRRRPHRWYQRQGWSVVATAPPGKVGQISDVVDGILFLESSPDITGEILNIDGGQTAGL